MEYLVSVLIWILACYGMTTIIVSSVAFAPIRKAVQKISVLHKLINCMLCMGFWVGVFWGSMFWDPFSNIETFYPLRLLFNGCFGAATTWLIYLKAYPLMYGK
tara:strand:- start:813 stop:1121 length:309 start_codon:yes stop_codon:yes gene_type:complete